MTRDDILIALTNALTAKGVQCDDIPSLARSFVAFLGPAAEKGEPRMPQTGDYWVVEHDDPEYGPVTDICMFVGVLGGLWLRPSMDSKINPEANPRPLRFVIATDEDEEVL